MQVIFCAVLCIFTNDIHVSVKNSSASGTCVILNYHRIFKKGSDLLITKKLSTVLKHLKPPRGD